MNEQDWKLQRQQLLDRVADLEADVSTWKECAAELGRQLATIRKANSAKAKPNPAKAKPNSAPPGFDAFWSAWPAHHRKADKRRCLEKWVAMGLEAFADEVVKHVEQCKTSKSWADGQYIPAPLVYLNQARFEAPPPPPQRQAGSLDGINYGTEGVNDDGFFS